LIVSRRTYSQETPLNGDEMTFPTSEPRPLAAVPMTEPIDRCCLYCTPEPEPTQGPPEQLSVRRSIRASGQAVPRASADSSSLSLQRMITTGAARTEGRRTNAQLAVTTAIRGRDSNRRKPLPQCPTDVPRSRSARPLVFFLQDARPLVGRQLPRRHRHDGLLGWAVLSRARWWIWRPK